MSLPLLETAQCLALSLPSDPQISPDGRWVAYVRRRADVAADLWVDEVVVCAVGDTGDDTGVGLTSAGARSVELGTGWDPRWSGDGATLAFVREGPDGHALVLWQPGAPDRGVQSLATLPAAPQGLSWSPTGAALAFTMFVPEPESVPLPRHAPWEALRTPAWAPAPVLTDRLVRRVEGLRGELPPGHHQVFLLDVATARLRQLTHGPWNHGGPLAKVTKLQLAGRISWDPDARRIVMSMQRHEGEAGGSGAAASPIDADVFEIDVESGEVRRLTNFGGPACQAVVSPDGRWIAFVGFRDQRRAFATNVVHVMPREGGEPRALPHPQAMEVHSAIRWRPDSRAVLAVLPDHGQGCLASVDLGGRWEVLCRDVGGSVATGYVTYEREFSVSAAGRIAYLQASRCRTDEVAVLAPPSPQGVRLSRESAWLEGHALAPVEEVELGPPAQRMQAWLLRPPAGAAQGRPPLILWLHGGPYLAWGPDFAIAAQLWAARGYAVLMPNPRGSLGYGERFTDLLHHDFPGPADLDLLAAVDEAVERFGLDGQRVYVAGESGGAVLTAWLIGHSGRFSAAAMLYGVVDWASMALTADRCDYFPRYWFPAPPTAPGMREHYWQRSPLAHVHKVRTPTLLLCGDEDWRTPFPQSEMFHTALRMQGTEAVLARFPGGCHGLDKRPSQQMATIDLVTTWFDRH